MSTSKPRREPADSRRCLASLLVLQGVGKGVVPFPVQICSELHIASDIGREAGVLVSERTDQRVATLTVNFTVDVAMPTIKSGLFGMISRHRFSPFLKPSEAIHRHVDRLIGPVGPIRTVSCQVGPHLLYTIIVPFRDRFRYIRLPDVLL